MSETYVPKPEDWKSEYDESLGRNVVRNKKQEEHEAKQKESKRRLDEELALQPRVARLEGEVRNITKICADFLEHFKWVNEWTDKTTEKNKERNARLDNLEKSARGASMERVAELMVDVSVLKNKVAELERRDDARKRHVSNLESKIAKRDAEPLKPYSD